MPSPRPAYALQAGAFSTARDAAILASRLQGRGLPAYTTSTTLPQRGTWHRVRIGPYANRRAARLAQRGLSRRAIATQLVQGD